MKYLSKLMRKQIAHNNVLKIITGIFIISLLYVFLRNKVEGLEATYRDLKYGDLLVENTKKIEENRQSQIKLLKYEDLLVENRKKIEENRQSQIQLLQYINFWINWLRQNKKPI